MTVYAAAEPKRPVVDVDVSDGLPLPAVVYRVDEPFELRRAELHHLLVARLVKRLLRLPRLPVDLDDAGPHERVELGVDAESAVRARR